MTLCCAGASSWCFLLSKRCRIFLLKSATPHIQRAFSRLGGRWCENTLVLVSLVWSTCLRKAEGRFPQRRGGCHSNRPLLIVLMQKSSKITQKKSNSFNKQILDISFFTCFIALTLAFAWNEKERQKYDGTSSHDY